MQYRNLGASGLKVSTVSLGAWLTFGGSVDERNAIAILGRAVDLGINFLDCADVYARGQAELVLGSFLREYRNQTGRHRSDLVLSTKVFWPMSDNVNDRGLSRKHIMESIDKSLRRLGTDYVDLYFCHRHDPSTPLEETVRAMDDLVRAGKVLYWGTSVWPAETIVEACGLAARHGWYAPRVEQPRYNLIDREIEADVLPACRKHGLGTVVWSPLAQGFLTGKYNGGVPEGSRGARTEWLNTVNTAENRDRVRKLTALAARAGTDPGTLALAWLLHQPGVTSVITGATSIAQLEQNAAAAGWEIPVDVAIEARQIFED